MWTKLGTMVGGLALVGGLVFFAAGSGMMAQASGPSDPPQPSTSAPADRPDFKARIWLKNSIIENAAQTIGIPVGEVRAGLQHGLSLDQIAARHGMGEEALERGILRHEAVDLARLVEQGKITRVQAEAVLRFLRNHIDQIVRYQGDIDSQLAGV